MADGILGINCGFNKGSSGGPWLLDYSDASGVGYVDGVTSELDGNGVTDWSPYFDDAAKNHVRPPSQPHLRRHVSAGFAVEIPSMRCHNRRSTHPGPPGHEVSCDIHATLSEEDKEGVHGCGVNSSTSNQSAPRRGVTK